MQEVRKAKVPWRDHRADIAVLFLGFAVPFFSWVLDHCQRKPDWFQRAGAIAVLAAGVVAYRSLGRHYRKFANNMERGFHLETSSSQRVIDWATLGLSIAGTLVWGYGDKFQGL
jgi:hypothetical protein